MRRLTARRRELVVRYVPMAVGIATRWAVRLGVDAPELVSAAYWGLRLAALRVRRGSAWVAYARETIRGEILHELRAARRARERAELRGSEAWPARPASRDDPALDRALGALTARELDAIHRRVWLDQSFAEMAAGMGISQAGARKVWARAIAKLRKARRPPVKA